MTTTTDAGTDAGTDTTTTTDTTATGADSGTGTTTTTDTGTDTAPDHAAEAKKWRDLARKHEQQAKANAAAAKELEAVKASQMSEQEKAIKKAVDDAVSSTRAEVLKEVGGTLAESAIRVAAAGRNVDVDALIEGIDASKFLDDSGHPDVKAIDTWVNKVAPKPDTTTDGDKPPVRRDLGNGARGGQAPPADSQLERDLKAKLGIS